MIVTIPSRLFTSVLTGIVPASAELLVLADEAADILQGNLVNLADCLGQIGQGSFDDPFDGSSSETAAMQASLRCLQRLVEFRPELIAGETFEPSCAGMDPSDPLFAGFVTVLASKEYNCVDVQVGAPDFNFDGLSFGELEIGSSLEDSAPIASDLFRSLVFALTPFRTELGGFTVRGRLRQAAHSNRVDEQLGARRDFYRTFADSLAAQASTDPETVALQMVLHHLCKLIDARDQIINNNAASILDVDTANPLFTIFVSALEDRGYVYTLPQAAEPDADVTPPALFADNCCYDFAFEAMVAIPDGDGSNPVSQLFKHVVSRFIPECDWLTVVDDEDRHALRSYLQRFAQRLTPKSAIDPEIAALESIFGRDSAPEAAGEHPEIAAFRSIMDWLIQFCDYCPQADTRPVMPVIAGLSWADPPYRALLQILANKGYPSTITRGSKDATASDRAQHDYATALFELVLSGFIPSHAELLAMDGGPSDQQIGVDENSDTEPVDTNDSDFIVIDRGQIGFEQDALEEFARRLGQERQYYGSYHIGPHDDPSTVALQVALFQIGMLYEWKYMLSLLSESDGAIPLAIVGADPANPLFNAMPALLKAKGYACEQKRSSIAFRGAFNGVVHTVSTPLFSVEDEELLPF